jgi:membrane-associated phospholipid phosphatase
MHSRWRRFRSLPPGRQAAAVACVGLALFVALAWATISAFGAFPEDRTVARALAVHRPAPAVDGVAHALAFVGQPAAAVAITLVLALLAGRLVSRRHALLVVSMLGASLVTFAIKELAGGGGPPGAHMLDPSFPSGHTTFAAAVFGLAALFLLERRRFAPALACAALVATMGPSRILLGAHWLSDVLAGYAVGFAWLLLVLAVGRSWGRGSRAAAGGAAPAPATP